MVTLGGGATAQVADQIASLGSNLLMVTPGQAHAGRAAARPARAPVQGGRRRGHRARDLGSWPPWRRRAVQQHARPSTATRTGPPPSPGPTTQYLRVARLDARGRARSSPTAKLRAGAAVCVIGETVRQEALRRPGPDRQTIRLQHVLLRGDRPAGGEGAGRHRAGPGRHRRDSAAHVPAAHRRQRGCHAHPGLGRATASPPRRSQSDIER